MDPRTAATGPVASASFAPARIRAVDTYLSALAGGHRFRGAVLVASGARVLLAKGYDLANNSAGTPNTPDTLFRIGSVTKQFTALAVLKLQEQGKLTVTDRLCRHVSPCPAAWRSITIEHLLTHSSGIPNFTDFPDYDAFRTTTMSPAELLDLFRAKPTEFAPGTASAYSNSGFVVLGHLVERRTGRRYADFLRTEILRPLGLSATGYDVNRPVAPNHAVGYGDWGNTSAMADLDMSVPYSAGALYSSVTDLYRWNRFLLTGAPSVVTAETLKQMFTPRVRTESRWPGTPESYGYGWVVSGRGAEVAYLHSGGLPGFSAVNVIRPRDHLSITVLSNIELDGRQVAHDIETELDSR